jgi:hypothetical protein
MDQSDVKRIAAINDLTDTHTGASPEMGLVHGKFDGEVTYDPENIIVRGHKIKIFKEKDPETCPGKVSGWTGHPSRPATSRDKLASPDERAVHQRACEES